MADPTPEALKRLGELVTTRRRDDLGIRQDQLAYGPSTTTMTQIETGERRVSDLSYRRLDQSLGWAEGTCLRVLAGGDPIVAVPKPPHRLDPRRDLFRGPTRDFDAEMAAIPIVKVDTSPLAELLLARRMQPEERTPEQWALIHAADERRDREAAAARRTTAEEPLVDLVEDGQLLAQDKNDDDVTAYVRKVETYVVSIMGIDRLTAALDWKSQERDMGRAVKGGVLVPFIEEIDRLRAEGVEGRELLRRMSDWLDSALTEPRAPLDTKRADPVGTGFREFVVPANSVELGDLADIRPGDEPPLVADAARTAPPGYEKGRGDQGNAGGDDKQDEGRS